MSRLLESLFPGLQTSVYQLTSPQDRSYNCIAWAAGASGQWWWPGGKEPRVHWPPGVAHEETLGAFVAVFVMHGYKAATDESLEPGTEKVALFADVNNRPTHAARQLPSGRWTSKLGEAEDIEHELRALEGEIYGKVVLILARPRASEEGKVDR